jgi:hypothetical protein
VGGLGGRVHHCSALSGSIPPIRLRRNGGGGVWGVSTFFSTFFLSYVINPRICHRLVGYIEEEVRRQPQASG